MAFTRASDPCQREEVLTDGVCGGDRELQIRCKQNPDAGSHFSTEHAVHEDSWEALEGARVCDGAGNCPCHVTTEGNGASEFENGSDAAGAPQLERLAPDRSSEGIGNIVGTCISKQIERARLCLKIKYMIYWGRTTGRYGASLRRSQSAVSMQQKTC
jgi:hypothetical protein